MFILIYKIHQSDQPNLDFKSKHQTFPTITCPSSNPAQFVSLSAVCSTKTLSPSNKCYKKQATPTHTNSASSSLIFSSSLSHPSSKWAFHSSSDRLNSFVPMASPALSNNFAHLVSINSRIMSRALRILLIWCVKEKRSFRPVLMPFCLED